MKSMNSKETKEMLKWLSSNFDCELSFDNYFFEHDNGKIYMANKEVAGLDMKKLRIDSIGLYFCRRMPDGFRPTIEGSQIIGKFAKANVIDVAREQMNAWLKGEDLVCEEGSGYVIVKCGKDFLGSGKFKDKKILNYVPKVRRLSAIME